MLVRLGNKLPESAGIDRRKVFSGALASMDRDERMLVEAAIIQMTRSVSEAKPGIKPNFGRLAAMEVVACLGIWLQENEPNGEPEEEDL